MLMGAGAPATGAADTASVPPVSAINAAARAHRARKRVVTSYHPLHGQATSADDAAGHYALSGMGCATRGASYPASRRGTSRWALLDMQPRDCRISGRRMATS